MIIIYHSFFSTKVITNLLYISCGDNMRKKFKAKKKFNIKYLLLFFIIIFIVFIFNCISTKIRKSINNKVIINNVFKIQNKYSYYNIENTSISNNFFNYIKEKTFNSPVNILKSELNYSTNEKEVINFMYAETKSPRMYIYNSHQGETYSMKYLEEYNIVPNILMVSNMFKDKLENIGINSIVEESDILAYMKQNNLNHAGSYKASRNFLNKIINNYPDLDLYIDIHRDATTHQISTTTINGKPCAKVLFVIGLENPNYQNNLEIVSQINNIILKKYPNLTRGILKKQGYGVNGIYNQDLNSRVILIEIGGNENNIEEVNNTLDLMSEVIGEYLNEKE